MIEIKDLLLKFSSKILKEEMYRETIRAVISDTIGFSIKPEDIKIKNGTVYLNIKPIYKSEILLKREKIDSLLRESISERTPQDIR